VRAIFINRFYWPDEPATAQLLTDLAEALAALGGEIVVVTSHPGRPEVPTVETHRGVRILRVRGTKWAGRYRLAGKAADFATFFLGALLRLLVTARRGDAIVAMTDPPLLGIGVGLVARLRRARLFHWVQDIYPELAIELAGQRWLSIAKPLRDLAWRRAERCITLGSDMATVLTRAGVEPQKITLSPNWAPAGLVQPTPEGIAQLRTEWGLTGKFVVAYSGNLGRVHYLEPVLAAAEALRDDPRITFLFIGGGAQRASLEAAAASRGLTNVQFRPPQARARLSISLGLGDAHLVTLRPGCEHYVFPSKLAGIAALGRPVIFIGPRESELGRIVAAPNRELGLVFEGDDISALAAAVRLLAGDTDACARFSAASTRYAGEIGGPAMAAARWRAWLAGWRLAAPSQP
jgi:glycosyltransferase involved in cell wall biosynthesis